MEELRPGLWWWRGRHPAWTEDQAWGLTHGTPVTYGARDELARLLA